MARMGEKSGAYKVRGGAEDRQKKQPTRPRCRREDNIKANLQEIKWGGSWVDLAQDKDRLRALVIAVLNLWAT